MTTPTIDDDLAALSAAIEAVEATSLVYIDRPMCDRIARLIAALREAREDAERYRWLAANKSKRLWNHVIDDPQGNTINEAIDAARAATKGAA